MLQVQSFYGIGAHLQDAIETAQQRVNKWLMSTEASFITDVQMNTSVLFAENSYRYVITIVYRSHENSDKE